jgi:IstB-like ATP binding protein
VLKGIPSGSIDSTHSSIIESSSFGQLRGPHKRNADIFLLEDVTNIDFESWADYLGDAPPAMALLDRVVDGATIVKLTGKSYRAHRGPDKPPAK